MADHTGDFREQTSSQARQADAKKKKGGKKVKKLSKQNRNLKTALYVEKQRRKMDKKLYEERMEHQQDKDELKAYRKFFSLLEKRGCLASAEQIIDVEKYMIEDSRDDG